MKIPSFWLMGWVVFLAAGCGGASEVTGDEDDYTGWLDTTAGLMWQNPDTLNPHTWEDARKYCNNLLLEGHTDWRLPTLDEARTQVRGCPATEPGGECGFTDACTDNETCWNHSCDGCTPAEGPGQEGAYADPALEFRDLFVTHWTSTEAEESWVFGLGPRGGGISKSSRNGQTRFRCVRTAQ